MATYTRIKRDGKQFLFRHATRDLI